MIAEAEVRDGDSGKLIAKMPAAVCVPPAAAGDPAKPERAETSRAIKGNAKGNGDSAESPFPFCVISAGSDLV